MKQRPQLDIDLCQFQYTENESAADTEVKALCNSRRVHARRARHAPDCLISGNAAGRQNTGAWYCLSERAPTKGLKPKLRLRRTASATLAGCSA